MKTPSKKTNSNEANQQVLVISIVLFVIILLIPIKVHLKTFGVSENLKQTEKAVTHEKLIVHRIEHNMCPLPSLKPELIDREYEMSQEMLLRHKVVADNNTEKIYDGNLYNQLTTLEGELLTDAGVEMMIQYYGKPESEPDFLFSTNSGNRATDKFVSIDFLKDELREKNQQIQAEIELEWQLKKFGTDEKESLIALESWMIDDICWCPEKRTKAYKEYISLNAEEK